MKVTLHPPRNYEAEMRPPLKGDIEIVPRFYQIEGMVPLLAITTQNSKGKERRFLLQISAGKGILQVREMKEVVPIIDMADDATPETTEPAVETA